jgi:hypothetical protein
MTARAATVDRETYAHQTQQTLQALNTIDDTSLVSLTGLNLPEVQAIKQEIAEIFPASNLPLFLLQGLLQLKDRTLPQERVDADLQVLFRGTRQIGLYSTFLAAPAMLLHGYQQLLTLAGKSVDSAFPNGPWQFYTEFGLREDTARHAVETVGFQQSFARTSDLNAATCWIYAAILILFAYDDLLANEWHERVMLRALDQALEQHVIQQAGRKLPRKTEERTQFIAERVAALRQEYHLQGLASGWAARRPYSAPSGTLPQAYPAYRREQFQAYLDHALRQVPADLCTAMDQIYAERCRHDLPAYQEQMTIVMRLRPEVYQEHHDAFALDTARVALVSGGHYFLIDLCDRDPDGHLLLFPRDGAAQSAGIPLPLERADDGSLHDRYGRTVTIDRAGQVHAGDDRLGRLRPPPLTTIKSRVDAILRAARPQKATRTTATEQPDRLLTAALREGQNDLRAQLDAETQESLNELGHAPIILNWDQHTNTQPLRDIRNTRRGCGDHALTLVRTNRSMVFDMSHVFFDGMWGMALAEMITGFATALHPAVESSRAERISAGVPLTLTTTPEFLEAARSAVAASPIEVSAETTIAARVMQDMGKLRRRLAAIKLELTVNDLLLLTRSVHAAGYTPGATARKTLDAVGRLENGWDLRERIEQYWEEERTINPALLIPMDAGAVDPRLRLFPATFRNPLPGLLPRLTLCDDIVQTLRRRANDPGLQEFTEERRALYSELKAYGMLLQTLRQVTMRGESFATAALRLLSHLPGPMQHIMDLVPQKIDILNEIIKGREVFSNVGQVAGDSSLTRFASSRDDGETKLLVWGFMTDAAGQLCITLRDFRPHVADLVHLEQREPAQALTQDYLDAYAASVELLVRRIQRIFAYK